MAVMTDILSHSHVGSVDVLLMTDRRRSNPLTVAMVHQLRKAIEATRPPNVVVLASDARNFCTGGDHKEYEELDPAQRTSFIADAVALFESFSDSSLSSVAAVHGGAIGGGLELALRCDFIVAAEDSWFQFPQVALGSPLNQTSAALLLSRTGMGLARKISFRGQRIPAVEARDGGLVDFMVPRDELRDTAVALATELAAQPQENLAGIRRVLNRAVV